MTNFINHTNSSLLSAFSYSLEVLQSDIWKRTSVAAYESLAWLGKDYLLPVAGLGIALWGGGKFVQYCKSEMERTEKEMLLLERANHEQACEEAASDSLVVYLTIHRDFHLVQLSDWKAVGFSAKDWKGLITELQEVGLSTIEYLREKQIGSGKDLQNFMKKMKFDRMWQKFINDPNFKLNTLDSWHQMGIYVDRIEDVPQRLVEYGLESLADLEMDRIRNRESLKKFIDDEFEVAWWRMTDRWKQNGFYLTLHGKRSYCELNYGFETLTDWQKAGINAKSLDSVKLKLKRLGLSSGRILDFRGITNRQALIDYLGNIQQKPKISQRNCFLVKDSPLNQCLLAKLKVIS